MQLTSKEFGSISFIFAGMNIAFQGIFQALDSGPQSLVISVLRQFILVLPVAYGFSLLAKRSMDNAWTIWLTFIIAELVSAVISVIFMRGVNKKKIEIL